MSSFILPVPTIVLQILLLLVTIAIEALILQRMMRMGYKTSVEYSTSINLFSSSLGWIIFLIYLQASIPEGLKTKIISYMLFAKFDTGQLAIGESINIFLGGLFAFITVWFLEWQGLNLLQWLLEYSPNQDTGTERKYTRPSLSSQQDVGLMYSQNRKAYVIMLANVCSHGAVLAILFISQLRWFNP